MFETFEQFSEWIKKELWQRKQKSGKSMPLRDVLQMTWDAASAQNPGRGYALAHQLREENERLKNELDEAQRMISRLHNAMPAPIYAMEGKTYAQFRAEEAAEHARLTTIAPDDARIGANFGGVRDNS